MPAIHRPHGPISPAAQVRKTSRLRCTSRAERALGVPIANGRYPAAALLTRMPSGGRAAGATDRERIADAWSGAHGRLPDCPFLFAVAQSKALARFADANNIQSIQEEPAFACNPILRTIAEHQAVLGEIARARVGAAVTARMGLPNETALSSGDGGMSCPEMHHRGKPRPPAPGAPPRRSSPTACAARLHE